MKETNPTVFQMNKRTTLKEGGKNSRNVQRVFAHTPSMSDGVPRCAKYPEFFSFPTFVFCSKTGEAILIIGMRI